MKMKMMAGFLLCYFFMCDGLSFWQGISILTGPFPLISEEKGNDLIIYQKRRSKGCKRQFDEEMTIMDC